MPSTLAALVYFRKEIFSVRWPAPPGMQVLGIVSFAVALVVFRQASIRIPFRTLVGLPEVEPHKKVQPVLTSGIYSKTRNPIYFAHWLLLLGAAAWSGYAANWIWLALDGLILPVMVRVEERELLDRYGADFAAYMRSVPRFLPKIR